MFPLDPCIVLTCCSQSNLFPSLIHWWSCLLSYITAALSPVFIPLSTTYTSLCDEILKNPALCLSRWLWRRCWESPRQETAVWPVTPDLDWWPTLQGKKRDLFCILISTSDLWLINTPRFLIISTSHRRLVCKFLCVCYLCTISEELRRRALSSEKLQSFFLSCPQGGFKSAVWYD